MNRRADPGANVARDPLELYHGVSDVELLRAHGLFVAEGRLVVRRVLEDPRYRVHSILVNEAARRQLDDVLNAAGERIPVITATAAQFVEATGFNMHRGCLALVHRPAPYAIDDVIAAGETLLALDGVANADNVGGAFRNAAAFGAAGVVLSPACCDPLYRKAIRTSMGASLRVPFCHASGWPAPLAAARAEGFMVAALTPREPAEPLERFAAGAHGRRVIIVAGAEGAGVSREVEAVADVRVRIQMAPGIDSLNVAVAVGIALHAIKTSTAFRPRSAAAARPTSPGRRMATRRRR